MIVQGKDATMNNPNVSESRGPTPTIEATGLSMVVSPRRGDSLTILNDIAFTAYPGEMTGIIGPSGSGKSTLLYCLAGLEKATSGTVLLLGKDITRLGLSAMTKFRRQHLGFVFQSYNLITSMTVEQNLALPFTLRGSRFPRKTADSLLKYFGLIDQKKKSVTLLSGGEQQRVALARVLLSDADVVFADEPTGALDQESGEKVISVLKELANHEKKTIVLVTHNNEVAGQCDRLFAVRDGRISQSFSAKAPMA
ncbi:ABC transporter [Bifidobacterium asteroides]|uniref:ABC transporter n=2 Tax=Bifidobacterium TaxID=1678 RepID=A0A2N3RBF8_9BIFI|nr:ABC transporter [Bifidobacterium asteroides]